MHRQRTSRVRTPIWLCTNPRINSYIKDNRCTNVDKSDRVGPKNVAVKVYSNMLKARLLRWAEGAASMCWGIIRTMII
jgi:hypothetical protein